MIPFGKLIKDARLELGFTQAQVAELADNICTAGYISNIERNADVGKKGRPVRPGIDIVDKLAEVLKIPQKTARTTANYASPEEEDGGHGEISTLFSYYDRLDAPYKKMAIKLMGGTLISLYELQIGKSVRETSPIRQSADGAKKGVKRIPVLQAATEQEIEQKQLVGKK